MAKKVVSGIFKTRIDAEQAVQQLENAGFKDSQISMLMSDETRGKGFSIVDTRKVDEGIATGATLGGLVGVILASIGAAGAIAMPGLNLVVAGPIAGALAGLGTGALTGGLVGGLVGMGFHEQEARLYDKEVRAGRILLAVETQDDDRRVEQIEKIFQRTHADSIAA